MEVKNWKIHFINGRSLEIIFYFKNNNKPIYFYKIQMHLSFFRYFLKILLLGVFFIIFFLVKLIQNVVFEKRINLNKTKSIVRSQTIWKIISFISEIVCQSQPNFYRIQLRNMLNFSEFSEVSWQSKNPKNIFKKTPNSKLNLLTDIRFFLPCRFLQLVFLETNVIKSPSLSPYILFMNLADSKENKRKYKQ